MDPKLKALMERTNIDELVNQAPLQFDLHQPVQSGSVAPIEPMRSTADPLQINFATADMIGKLREPGTNSRLRTIAVIFIGSPMMLFSVIMLGTAWTSPSVSLVRALIVSAFALAMFAFWPWLIYSGRSRRANSAS